MERWTDSLELSETQVIQNSLCTSGKLGRSSLRPVAVPLQATGSHQIRSSDRKTPNTCTRRQLWMMQGPLYVFYIIERMSVKNLFHGRVINGGEGDLSVLTFRKWTSVSYRCQKWTWQKWDKGKQMADQSDMGFFPPIITKRKRYKKYSLVLRTWCEWPGSKSSRDLCDTDTVHVSCNWDAQMKDTVKWLKVWKGN